MMALKRHGASAHIADAICVRKEKIVSRLIDADELIVTLGKCLHGDNFANACKAIDDAQTIEQQHWIPCSEKSPEKEDIYLVYLDESNLLENEISVMDAFWLDGKWQYGVLESFEHKNPKLVVEPIEELSVIALMPLPEVYKGEQL